MSTVIEYLYTVNSKWFYSLFNFLLEKLQNVVVGIETKLRSFPLLDKVLIYFWKTSHPHPHPHQRVSHEVFDLPMRLQVWNWKSSALSSGWKKKRFHLTRRVSGIWNRNFCLYGKRPIVTKVILSMVNTYLVELLQEPIYLKDGWIYK